MAPPPAAEGAFLDVISADHSEVIREDTTRAAHTFWSVEIRIEVCVRWERWHISPLHNHLSRCCRSVGHYLRDHSLSGHAGLFCICSQSFALTFLGCHRCVQLAQVAALCINHWLIYCNRVNAVYINIGYLFNHTFTYKHRYTHLFTHPRRHTNTRRPINLLFDSGFNLLSATPLAGPASQLSGNKEAGVWWRGSNRRQHHKSCLSLFEPWCPCTCVQGRELKICWIFGLDVDGGGG